MSAYELERQANIARNQGMLAQLGLADKPLIPPGALNKKSKSGNKGGKGKIKRKSPAWEEPVEQRKCARFTGKKVDYVGLSQFPDDVEERERHPGSRHSSRSNLGKRAAPFEIVHERVRRPRKQVTYKEPEYSDDDSSDDRVDSDDDDGCLCKIETGLQSGRWIDCSRCQRWVHFECAGIDPSTPEEELEDVTYTCAKCDRDDDSSDEEGSAPASFTQKRTAPMSVAKDPDRRQPAPQRRDVQSSTDYSAEAVYLPRSDPIRALQIRSECHQQWPCQTQHLCQSRARKPVAQRDEQGGQQHEHDAH